MSKSEKTLEFKFERTIPALPSDVFDGWLNPKIPGNPWHMADKLLLDPKVDGMFYWTTKDTPHYGLFTEVERPSRIRHTWMSPNTLGRESTVTVTFRKQGDETRMTLVHSNLPEDDKAKSHEKGWNYFLDMFPKQFGSVSSEKK